MSIHFSREETQTNLINNGRRRTFPSVVPTFKVNYFMNTKQLVFVAVMLIATGSLYAQGNGSAGITEATKMVTSYFDPGTKLCYAIGAVVGLVGGIKVYNKFSSGDPDTSKTAASWFGACIFLIVAATILRSFFL